MSEYKKRYTHCELDFAKRLQEFGKRLRDNGFCPVKFYSYYNNALSAALCGRTKPDATAQITNEGLRVGGSVLRYDAHVEIWADALNYDLYMDNDNTVGGFLEKSLKDLKTRFKDRLEKAETPFNGKEGS